MVLADKIAMALAIGTDAVTSVCGFMIGNKLYYGDAVLYG